MTKLLKFLQHVLSCTLAIIAAILLGLAAPLLMPVFLIVAWWVTKAFKQTKQISSN